MTSKKLALLSGAGCIAVLVTYAWAVSQEASYVKAKVKKEIAADVKTSEATTKKAAEDPAKIE